MHSIFFDATRNIALFNRYRFTDIKVDNTHVFQLSGLNKTMLAKYADIAFMIFIMVLDVGTPGT